MRSKQPQPISELIAQLFATKGYGRMQAEDDLRAAWYEAVGEATALVTQPGKIRRGTLEVLAANSLLLQELTFRQIEIVGRLKKLAPQLKIEKLRFKVGAVGKKV